MGFLSRVLLWLWFINVVVFGLPQELQRHGMSAWKFRYVHHNIPSAFPIPNFAALIEIERGTAWSLIKVACRAIIRPAAAVEASVLLPLSLSIQNRSFKIRRPRPYLLIRCYGTHMIFTSRGCVFRNMRTARHRICDW